MMRQTESQSPSRDRSDVLADSVAAVRDRIAAAAERVGRSPASVALVVVSKTVSPELVSAAAAVGVTDFGEARAAELVRKHDGLGAGLRWHFVGRLQRNKVRDVVGRAQLIHSVDRLELAQKIGLTASRDGRVQPVLVQVNTGADPQKGGCAPDEALDLVGELRAIEGLSLQGLMTVPPLDEDPRPAFRRLAKLRNSAQSAYDEVRHLSMGMSGDYEIAVEEGATIVRIGEAIFGLRDEN